MKTIFSIFLTFCTFVSFSQNDATVLENDAHLNYIFSLDINSFVPSGNLKESLDNSLGIGFYFGLPLNEKIRLDFGISLFFPDPKKPVLYINNSEILKGGASTSGALGVWTTHVTPIGKNWSWEKRVGLGLGFFQTDIETGKPKEENDSVYGAETIFFSLGTAVRVRVFKRNIGLKLDYFYTPYNLFKKKLSSSFGEAYFTLGLTFGL